MWKRKKVTSDALREMGMGQTAVFQLPCQEPALSRSVNSGKTLAYRLQRELGCRFSTAVDYVNATLTITKNARL